MARCATMFGVVVPGVVVLRGFHDSILNSRVGGLGAIRTAPLNGCGSVFLTQSSISVPTACSKFVCCRNRMFAGNASCLSRVRTRLT